MMLNADGHSKLFGKYSIAPYVRPVTACKETSRLSNKISVLKPHECLLQDLTFMPKTFAH